MAPTRDALEIFLGYNNHKNAYESIKMDEYQNVMFSTHYHHDSFCTLIPDNFNASGVVMVISPYIDKINSQIEYLDDVNVSAITITHETSLEEREYIYRNFNHQIFFVTPAMFKKGHRNVKGFIDHLLDQEVSLVVVEKSDLLLNSMKYRESYKVLGDVRSDYPHIPWIAMSTGSYFDIQRIARSFSMSEPIIVRH